MEQVTSKDGTKIVFDRSGEGPPIILVGGALNTRSFGPNGSLAPLLAEHFTVINYDRRARDDSGDTQPWAVEREIEDIGALIEAAGGKSPDWIRHTMRESSRTSSPTRGTTPSKARRTS